MSRIEQPWLLAGVTVQHMASEISTPDTTIDRLLALNVRLTQAMLEARIIRMQFLKARDADAWPDVGRAPRLLADAQPPNRA